MSSIHTLPEGQSIGLKVTQTGAMCKSYHRMVLWGLPDGGNTTAHCYL